MEPAVDNGWFHEVKKYFLSVENLTENLLKRIKLIQNNLQFDDSFKDFLVNGTSARIGNEYTNFLFEERLDGGQNVPKQVVNQRNDGDPNIGQQLISTAIGPESIDRMSSISVKSNNLNLPSIATASTTFVQDGNQLLSDQIIIPLASNQLPSVSTQVDNPNQNPERELSVQRVESVAKGERRMEDEITDEPLIESNPNNHNRNVSSMASKKAVVSTSTDAHRPKCEQLANSNEQHPETIDLTSDQEELVDDNENERLNFVSDILQRRHATNINSENENIFVPSDDDLELTSTIDDAVTLHANEQIHTVMLSDTNTQANLLNSIIDTIGVRACNNFEQRQNAEDASATGEKTSSKQFAETINLISNQEDAADRGEIGNGGVQNVVHGQSQPTAQRRKRENCTSTANAEHTTKRHKCDFCEYSTEYKCNLKTHVRTHFDERPFECKVCEKQFAQKSHLNRHMKTHRNMFAYQCSNCRQGFLDQKLWKLHENRCKSKQYECYLCYKKCYHQKGQLLYHMRREHTGEPFSCSDCREQFCSKSNLTQHVKRCHQKDCN